MFECIGSIVVYNNPPDMIRAAAESFLRTSLKVKLFVIDNSPTPKLRTAFDGLPIEYHHANCNQGYGRGHNWGIQKEISSSYYTILNPDVVVSEGSLEGLMKFMEARPDVGAVCPKVLNLDGSIQPLNHRQATVLDLALRRFLPGSARPWFQNRLDYYEMKDIGYESIYEVPSLTGAFMFCRSDALKSIGGFDPRYFLYFEDVDLSRKFQTSGFKTIYFPAFQVTHHWERASYKSLRMAFFQVRSAFQYFNKWGWKLF